MSVVVKKKAMFVSKPVIIFSHFLNMLIFRPTGEGYIRNGIYC